MNPNRGVLACLLALPLAVMTVSRPVPQADPIVAKALAIHKRVISLDSHVDIAGANYATPALDPGAPDTNLKCDLTKMEKGGLTGAFLAVFVAQGPLDDARRCTRTVAPLPRRRPLSSGSRRRGSGSS
jgi:membrane dipeptidase